MLSLLHYSHSLDPNFHERGKKNPLTKLVGTRYQHTTVVLVQFNSFLLTCFALFCIAILEQQLQQVKILYYF